MQIQCVNCGRITSASNYCPVCGARLPVVTMPPVQTPPPQNYGSNGGYGQAQQGYQPPPDNNSYQQPDRGYGNPYRPADNGYADPYRQNGSQTAAQRYSPNRPEQNYTPNQPQPQNYNQNLTQNNYQQTQGYNNPQPAQNYNRQPQNYNPGQNQGYNNNQVQPYNPNRGYNSPQAQSYNPQPAQNQNNYRPYPQMYAGASYSNGNVRSKEGKSYAGTFVAVLLLPLFSLYEFLQRHFARGVIKLLLLAAMITLFSVAAVTHVSYTNVIDTNYQTVNYSGQTIAVQHNGQTYSMKIVSNGTTRIKDEDIPEYYLSSSSYSVASNAVKYANGGYVRIGNYAYRLSVGYSYSYSSSYNNDYYYNLTFVGDYQNGMIRRYNISYPNEGLETPAGMICATLAIWQFVDAIVILCKLCNGKRIVKKRA